MNYLERCHRYHREGRASWSGDLKGVHVGGEWQGREVSRCFLWRSHPEAGREEKVMVVMIENSKRVYKGAKRKSEIIECSSK